jgi:hypothetical protein
MEKLVGIGWVRLFLSLRGGTTKQSHDLNQLLFEIAALRSQ